MPGGISATSAPSAAIVFWKLAVFFRIDDVETAREDGDGAGPQRGAMRGRVDAAGKTGNDGDAFGTEGLRHLARDAPPGRRRVARSDDRDELAACQCDVASDGNDGWRRIERGEAGREGIVAEYEKFAADLPRCCDFSFGVCRGCDLHRAFRTAARGKIRQSIESGDGIAEMIEKVAEGDGADILASGKAETGQPLWRGERRRHMPSGLRLLLTDARLRSGDEARDVFAMREVDEKNEEDAEADKLPLVEPGKIDRRQQRGDERRERGIAETSATTAQVAQNRRPTGQ